ncbi:hypothetical protein COU37_03460 [Candidatus Micrarchaeota archaeon CG10_big_fil_rev_8_21_14_0_10_45_29]|nr:MAG: hypothetical protein COU37_03460 [Candidatus Micrarchaeota archaeon CG10_big_fil_rev_8_21_14_0_10_45_29]
MVLGNGNSRQILIDKAVGGKNGGENGKLNFSTCSAKKTAFLKMADGELKYACINPQECEYKRNAVLSKDVLCGYGDEYANSKSIISKGLL